MRKTENLSNYGPFDLDEQELVLSVLRTNSLFQHRFGRLFRQYGLSEPQFNILWMLGRTSEPIPCLEVARRLIAVVPAITRLIDNLIKRGLVQKKRNDEDRRVWLVTLTAAGQKLLDEMSEPNLEMHQSLVGHLTKTERKQLIALLAKARSPIEAAAPLNP